MLVGAGLSRGPSVVLLASAACCSPTGTHRLVLEQLSSSQINTAFTKGTQLYNTHTHTHSIILATSVIQIALTVLVLKVAGLQNYNTRI